MRRIVYTVVLFVALAFEACDQQVESVDDRIGQLKLEALPAPIDPANNSGSVAKELLGKVLFYDPILSGEKDVACVTCHLPDRGYADGLDLSIGVGGKGLGPGRVDNSNGRIPILGRNSQSIINTAFNGMISAKQSYDPLLATMFWDGRKKSLESQCIGPPSVFNIMRGNAYSAALTNDSIVTRLKKIAEYNRLFEEAFGPNSISMDNLSKAIAAFERTIISANSPYDMYVRGDKNALTYSQKMGIELFYGKANCATCHSGPMFSDFNYYNLGIAYNPKRSDPDKGVDNKFLFRTPSLRNVDLTAPYMHNGVLPTLESVMSHYVTAVSGNTDIPTVDPKIQPLNLNQEEVNAIIDFLHALTDDGYDKEQLTSVPSGLKPAGN